MEVGSVAAHPLGHSTGGSVIAVGGHRCGPILQLHPPVPFVVLVRVPVGQGCRLRHRGQVSYRSVRRGAAHPVPVVVVVK